MKKNRIIYWVLTVVFAGFMAFTAIPDILQLPDSAKFMNHLGYPNYFTHFISIAKFVGAIAILIPNFRLVKEWAYAGLFFDLTGALYSNMMVDGPSASMLITMVLLYAFGIGSYVYNRRVYGTAPVAVA
ncbi:MAG TPA: DoxX family protein [Puia sp.]|nr:DoxX family protein [Puia sp.]